MTTSWVDKAPRDGTRRSRCRDPRGAMGPKETAGPPRIDRPQNEQGHVGIGVRKMDTEIPGMGPVLMGPRLHGTREKIENASPGRFGYRLQWDRFGTLLGQFWARSGTGFTWRGAGPARRAGAPLPPAI